MKPPTPQWADVVLDNVCLSLLMAALVTAAGREWWLALLLALCALYALLLGGLAAFMVEALNLSGPRE